MLEMETADSRYIDDFAGLLVRCSRGEDGRPSVLDAPSLHYAFHLGQAAFSSFQIDPNMPCLMEVQPNAANVLLEVGSLLPRLPGNLSSP